MDQSTTQKQEVDLQQRLHALSAEYEARCSTGDRLEALKTLERNLTDLTRDEALLPSKFRESLARLIALRIKLPDPEAQQTAHQLLSDLEHESVNDRMRVMITELAGQWVELAQDEAAQGYISSQVALGNLLAAYEAARSYVIQHPQSEAAVRQLSEIRGQLLDQLNSRALKRLDRAQELFEHGYFYESAEALQDIEQTVYGPVESEFPEVLRDDATTARVRADAEMLFLLRRQRLQAILDDANRALTSGDLLKTSEHVRGCMELARRLSDTDWVERAELLRRETMTRITRLLDEQITGQLRRLDEGETTNRHELQELDADNPVFRDHISALHSLGTDEEILYMYSDQLRSVRDLTRRAYEQERLREEAEQTFERGDFEGATALMQYAFALSRGKARYQMEQRLKEMQRASLAVREAWGAVRTRDYAKAKDLLSHIRGAQGLKDLRTLAEAGALLESAYHAWQAMEWENAASTLNTVFELVSGNEPMDYRVLYSEAHVLRRQIELSREAQLEIQGARLDLLSGQVEAAAIKLEHVTDKTGAHPTVQQELGELREQVRRAVEANGLLEQAREALAKTDFALAKAYVARARTTFPDLLAAQALQREVEQAEKKQKDDQTETGIRALLANAKEQFGARLFATCTTTLNKAGSEMVQLPEPRRAPIEIEMGVLRTEIAEAEEAWSDYSQARVHVLEGHHESELAGLREAEALLNRVIQRPPREGVMRSIQREAEQMLHGVLMGAFMMEGNFEEIEKRLMRMIAINPHDISIVASLQRIQDTKYLRGFAEDADETRRMARKEARGWYIASLVSAAIFSGLFIYAVLFVLLTRPDDTLSYLTPLYTFVPGVLSAVFFKQYTDANRRLDEEQKKLWERVEDFHKEQTQQMNAVREQATKTTSQTQTEGATAS